MVISAFHDREVYEFAAVGARMAGVPFAGTIAAPSQKRSILVE